MSMPSADAVNMHLGGKPDQPGAPCPPVPDVPGHDEAMSTGSEAYAHLPAVPEAGSKHVGGPDTGYPS